VEDRPKTPLTTKLAAGVFLGELLGMLAGGLGQSFGGHESSVNGSSTSAIIGISTALLVGCLLWLPASLVRTKYPRRRYKEAMLFQGIVVLVCVLSLVGHATVLSASYLCAAALVAGTLLTRSSRAYVDAMDESQQIGPTGSTSAR
jgi:hypothetical protein